MNDLMQYYNYIKTDTGSQGLKQPFLTKIAKFQGIFRTLGPKKVYVIARV